MFTKRWHAQEEIALNRQQQKEPVAPVSPVAPVRPAQRSRLRSAGKLEAHVYYEFIVFPRHRLRSSKTPKLFIKELCAQSNALHAHEVSAVKESAVNRTCGSSQSDSSGQACTNSITTILRSAVRQAGSACAQ